MAILLVGTTYSAAEPNAFIIKPRSDLMEKGPDHVLFSGTTVY